MISLFSFTSLHDQSQNKKYINCIFIVVKSESILTLYSVR